MVNSAELMSTEDAFFMHIVDTSYMNTFLSPTSHLNVKVDEGIIKIQLLNLNDYSLKSIKAN